MNQSNNNPVCIFDSGIGGLTVLRKLLDKFPGENYIYFSDLARVPFGDKSDVEIKQIAHEIIEWLSKSNPKAIIMACNTSSSIVELTSSPQVYSIIEPCTKEIAQSNLKKVTVWATRLVTKQNTYKKSINKINPNIQVEEIACPKLVPMIESLNFTLEERRNVISEYLNLTSKDSETLVLGCTHYPLITDDIKQLANNIKITNPADAICKEIALNSSAGNGQISFYTTAEKEKLEKFGNLYLHREVKASLVTLNSISV